MTLAPGTRLGPYEIQSPLGAGGMGEVYRARDTRLGRDVAIKVLPAHLSAQPEIRSRFEREAKTVSSLNHPNICTLFDVGREDGTDFLVMELVEGDTLAERLRRGPLSASDLLRFGTQIADALDRAHRAGVIHRDLKPGNVMLTRSGAKLMDFGLARVTGMGGTSSGSGHTLAALTQSPTVAHPLTAEGTLLGTFQYMAPEQLEGREADARSDIWALGCVLYEMATGRRAFEGRSQASLIAAILEREPAPVGEPPSGVPAISGPPHGIERLIRNCLAKDPEERIQTAHDVKLQLQGIAEIAGISAASATASASQVGAALPRVETSRSGSRIAWSVAIVAVLATTGLGAWLLPQMRGPAAPWRFRIEATPGTVDLFWPRVSPDGRTLLFQAPDSAGIVRAYVRRMDQIEAVPIPGTEGIRRAYWSPDGREIAYVLNDRLVRVPMAGGAPVVICAAPGGADISWGSKGHVLMDGRSTDSLRVVPATGGDFKPASRIDRANHEVGSAWPCFLPDGEHFLFLGNHADGLQNNIRLGRLGSLDSKIIGHSDGRIEYAPGGWLLYVRGTTLLAQKLDLGKGALVGEPLLLVDGLRLGASQGNFSISPSGVLAFASNPLGDLHTLQIADRSGRLESTPLLSGSFASPRLSPDGKQLIYQRTASSLATSGELSLLDLERRTDTRLTFTNNGVTSAAWSPDGRRYAYVSVVERVSTLYLASIDGVGSPDSVPLPNVGGAALTQWGPEGRVLMYDGAARAFAVRVDGAPRTPEPFLSTTETVAHAQISPDGKWAAFVTGSGSSWEVFVQNVGGPAARRQISNSTGINPRWTRGGREIVYETLDGRLMAVDIDTQGGLRVGNPRLLFALPRRSPGPTITSWTCDAAGERFFLMVPPRGAASGVIEVVTSFPSLVATK